jgi:hypothetical protein
VLEWIIDLISFRSGRRRLLAHDNSGPPTVGPVDEPEETTMNEHRSTRPTVPKNAPFDNLNPADALESLHTEVVQLEAFAHLAAEIITRLPPPSSREQRRDYRRLYALVNRVADDAIAAVNHGDALISALSADMAARRAQRVDPPSAKA